MSVRYYFNGRTATVGDFTNVTYMQLLGRQIDAARRVAGHSAPLWISETGSAWGGGAPGLSDRYLAGFLWLDKLGVAAQHGVSLVVRQSLYGGQYAMLDAHMMPNPVRGAGNVCDRTLRMLLSSQLCPDDLDNCHADA